ncbi:phosphotransferase enzyme family protein [Desulfofustis glycolicus]|uniref:Phosphotransferase enzyme family protein n=1 Tax=Desulfofustis glycolicus DSM 9705 TaxID=1121409 RepID=A0A1M5WET1_9BACT|nr:aminoglycoside phosphotransferase family protein [Desulfofustis glycolicus]MCB2217053.1 aminoglycoside phosphotransferase family protein [Desulfobulbaceae bacterium]SHH85743.1 Phosphotransferase enzyme family protein [Desulfofustis glycolicus DSM 9705]
MTPSLIDRGRRVVCASFLSPTARPPEIEPLGAGRINDTFLVSSSGHVPLVLQRINGDVFPDPVCIAENVAAVTAHLAGRRQQSGGDERFPRLVPARDGKSCAIDHDGAVWRVIEYVSGAVSYPLVTSADQAFEVGRMLGRFHLLLDDFDSGVLRPPLPGFHDLPAYCRGLEQTLAEPRRSASGAARDCCLQVEQRLVDADALVRAHQRGELVQRLIHGDPKCDNVLFDRSTLRAVALIDLDTVSPGLVLWDLGDCLRSVCNPAGERPPDRRPGKFHLDLCRAVLTGYRAGGADLSAAERSLLFQGLRLLTFELGVRFLTDYLAGDRYFKVEEPEDNLDRARVQFDLLAQIEHQQAGIEALVADIWP